MARLLYQKLGIKEGMHLLTLNQPANYSELIDGIKNVSFAKNLSESADLIHLFAKSKDELLNGIIAGKQVMHKKSAFWISWPKLSGGISSDINREDVREAGLGEGLVDIKVASVDLDWSGLKFVIPIKNR